MLSLSHNGSFNEWRQIWSGGGDRRVAISFFDQASKRHKRSAAQMWNKYLEFTWWSERRVWVRPWDRVIAVGSVVMILCCDAT